MGRREIEQKRWLDKEVVDMLTYMQAHRRIEKPTAQTYYRKLLEETQIEASWTMVKCKVRHLKYTLQKAEAFRRSNDGGLDDRAVRAKMSKICPHYNQLIDLFKEYVEAEALKTSTGAGIGVGDLHCTVQASPSKMSPDDRQFSDIFTEYAEADGFRTGAEIEEEDFECTMQAKRLKMSPHDSQHNDIFTTVNEVEAEEHELLATEGSFFVDISNLEGEEPASISKLVAVQERRNRHQENMLKLEKEKFLWAKEVEERKLRLEEKRIENEFRIKRMELDQKERIAKLELKLRYKINS